MRTRVSDAARHVRTAKPGTDDKGNRTTVVESHFEYVHKDHLGSAEAITDASGKPTQTLSHDPYGSRRHADWTAALTEAEIKDLAGVPGPRERGHSGHVHLDRTGLIHRGGRIYDPTLGRFLSPDPLVADPGSAQAWNGYSYVSNSPMSHVDPSGMVQAGPGCNVGPVMCLDDGGGVASGGGFGVEPVVSTYRYRYVDVFVSARIVPGMIHGGGNGPGALDGWWDFMDPFVEVFHHYVIREGIGQATGQVQVVGTPNISGKDISADGIEEPNTADSETEFCVCEGDARILKGNAGHIGETGGFGEQIVINDRSVAIDPVQFGGKAKVRPHLEDISGYVDGQLIFDNVAEVIGGRSPIPGINVRDALKRMNPDTLILELPGGKNDLGVVPIVLTVPCTLSCPSGTM